MNYTSEACAALGADIASAGRKESLPLRTFVSFYGRTPAEVAELWELCSHRILKTKLKHLFWALMYMKTYVAIDVITVLLDISYPTLDKWVWAWIEAIASRHVEIIDWNKRNRNVPDDVWCRVSVDGTDFQIGEPVPFDKRWKSPKAKGGAVKYEVAISIYSGDIVWIYGPHRGSKHDYAIFKEKLKALLDAEEAVETDAGYGYHGVSHDDNIRSRDDFQSDEERREKSDLRARHETCNRRFKQWGILKQQFRNDKMKHVLVFYAIAVMTQMSIDNGNVLFGCEPKTKKEARYYI